MTNETYDIRIEIDVKPDVKITPIHPHFFTNTGQYRFIAVPWNTGETTGGKA